MIIISVKHVNLTIINIILKFHHNPTKFSTPISAREPANWYDSSLLSSHISTSLFYHPRAHLHAQVYLPSVTFPKIWSTTILTYSLHIISYGVHIEIYAYICEMGRYQNNTEKGRYQNNTEKGFTILLPYKKFRPKIYQKVHNTYY